jgi:hypothetical protein
MGVLYQRVGDGTYLNSNASNILHEPMEFLILMGDISHEELVEAWLIVETEVVARAAERATARKMGLPDACAVYAAGQEADGIAAQAQAGFPELSLSASEWVDRADQSHSVRLGELLCGRPLQPVFLVYPKLGGEEDSVPLGQSPSAPRLRMEEVEQGMAVWHARTLQRVPSGLSTALLGGHSDPISPITLFVKCAGTRSVGNPHATRVMRRELETGGSGASPSYRTSSRPYQQIEIRSYFKTLRKTIMRQAI